MYDDTILVYMSLFVFSHEDFSMVS